MKDMLYLCIVCAVNSFWRAGVRHTSQPSYYQADFFSAEQRKQLDAEPRITVTEVAEVPDGAFIHAPAVPQARQEVSGDTVAPSADLADKTVAELRAIAQELGIEQLSNLKKAELIDAIHAVQAAGAETVAGGNA